MYSEHDIDSDNEHPDFPVPTPANLLSIQRTQTHDRYVGNFSKFVFKRTANPQNLSIALCPEEELSHYIQYHLHPTLVSILRQGLSSAQYFLWIACEISFMQMLDLDETASRWCSMRNRSFFSPAFHSEEEIRRYVTDFTIKFAHQALDDIFEMCSIYNSGWIYQCLL